MRLFNSSIYSFILFIILILNSHVVESVRVTKNETKSVKDTPIASGKKESTKVTGDAKEDATTSSINRVITNASFQMPEVEEYKLTYFNGRGRAEVIRLLFAQANVSYEDIRISQQQWPALKPKMPYGQLPVLDVNGTILAQSHAIEKYLARKFGLMGTNEWEAAKIDELTMGLEDLMQKMLPWIHEENDTKKIEMFKKLVKDEITPFLQRYEQFLAKSGTGYFVGNELSLADLAVFNMLQFFDGKLMPGHLKKYPKLDEFVVRIGQLPNIKDWVNKRPKTSF